MESLSSPKIYTIAIAASGSGGHLLPAIAIARAIEHKLGRDKLKLLFIGSNKGLESKLVKEAGYSLFQIPYAKVKRMGLKGLLLFLFGLPMNLFKTWQILNKEKVDLVIGVGGYVSVLPVLVARITGRSCMAHEAETKPGLANKVIMYFAHKITTSQHKNTFPKWVDTVYTGHPLRRELLEANYYKSLPSAPKNILIIGGSQGANALDQSILLITPLLGRLELNIRHQCRSENKSVLERSYEKAGVKAEVATFIANMTEAYQWSDIVIARAGAGLVRELDLVGRPCILLPLPKAQEQLLNAEDLAAKGQAIVIKEEELTRSSELDTLMIAPADIIAKDEFVSPLTLAYSELSQEIARTLKVLLTPSTYMKFARFSNSTNFAADPSTKIAEIAIELLNR
jgi:UDP-N-acetylglucosamine--N-acetylmuramyl-(pentapeptide) pyrophosphoryl-undecaprenol N-acetylglucosamine transferase